MKQVIKYTDEYNIAEPIIYSRERLLLIGVQFVGLAGGSNAISLGTLVGKLTGVNQYQAYDKTALDGRETCVGIVVQDIPALEEDEVFNGVIAVHGDFIEDKLIGMENDAITDLDAKEFTLTDGTVILSF